MKLTLRDLFWLVLVCALALGWWKNRRAWVLEHRALLDKAAYLAMDLEAAKLKAQQDEMQIELLWEKFVEQVNGSE